jgi:hypothetical protein
VTNDEVGVVAEDTFCNPTIKVTPAGVGSKPRHPEAHLTCFTTEDRTPTFTPTTVEVTNQFGTERLEVIQPTTLCTPTVKLEVDGKPGPGGTVTEVEAVLDHFRCYKVVGGKAPGPVLVQDQFDPTLVDALLGPATRLCAPVSKNEGRVSNSEAHLVCYAAESPTAPHRLLIANQFGNADVSTAVVVEVCVPSEKRIVPPPPPKLSHFKCYTVKAKGPFAKVFLTDQFGATDAVVRKPELLCNPADKEFAGVVTPRQNPEAHLKCYDIRDTTKPIKDRRVEVKNQFGSQILAVDGAERLCVPSSKSLTGTPGPPPTTLNHFKCYRVKEVTSLGPKLVALTDQFDKESVVVRAAEQLCNPVQKEHAGAVFPILPTTGPAHLTCYDIRSTKLKLRNVLVRNQFGLEEVRVERTELLCVPSDKRVL